MKRGRKRTTGRFDSVQELHEAVWGFYREGQSMTQAAKSCKISLGTASKILSHKKYEDT